MPNPEPAKTGEEPALTEFVLEDVGSFGTRVDFTGCLIRSGELTTGLAWTRLNANRSIAIREFIHLPEDLKETDPLAFLKDVRQSLVASVLAVRNPTVALVGYGVNDLPSLRLPESAACILEGNLLSEDPERWPGLHVQGSLTLAIPEDVKTGALASLASHPQAKAFLDKIFGFSVALNGDIWLDEEAGSAYVCLEWNRGRTESLSLRPGSDWNLTLTSFGVRAFLSNENRELDRISVGGILTLARHEVAVNSEIDLEAGVLRLQVDPGWDIRLGWLKELAGDRDYAAGASPVLDADSKDSKALVAPDSALQVKRIAAEIPWSPELSVRRLSATIGTKDETAWDVLGGKLTADITATWEQVNGDSRLDCQISGSWSWRKLSMQASLDTRSGDFFAKLDLRNDPGNEKLSEIAGDQFFKGLTPLPKGKELDVRGEAADQKVLDLKERLAQPFDLVDVEVSANYREKSLGVSIETEGFLTFTLVERPRDSRRKSIVVAIGELACEGAYEGVESGAWSLGLEGTVALLEGDEPKAFGSGARFRGEIESGRGPNPVAKKRFKLSIDQFRIGEMLQLLMDGDVPSNLQEAEVCGLLIDYDSSDSFVLKCDANIPLFGSTRLEGLELRICGSSEKQQRPEAAQAQEPKESAEQPSKEASDDDEAEAGKNEEKQGSTGTARLAFGDDIKVDLSVAITPTEFRFGGTARMVDLGKLLRATRSAPAAKQESSQKSVPVVQPPEAYAEETTALVVEELSVELTLARNRTVSRDKKPVPTGSLVIGSKGGAGKRSENATTGKPSLSVAPEGPGVQVLFAAISHKTEESAKTDWKVLFAVDTSLQSKDLPLVGDLIEKAKMEFSIGLHALYLKTRTGDAAKDEELAEPDAVQELFSKKLERIEIHPVWKDARLRERFNVRADLTPERQRLSGKGPSQQLDSPDARLSGDTAGSTTGAKEPVKELRAPDPPPDSAGLTWSALNKTIGPLHVSRIGYGQVPGLTGDRKAGQVALDAALDLGVLRLAVIGLGVRVDVPSLAVTPYILGLAIGVRNGPIEISGALVRRPGGPGQPDTYAGTALVRLPELTLQAVGSFSMRDGRPSFFLYCVCTKALGGPPAFFVEGLAGGMGHDTKLLMPSVEQVPEFALVKAARGKFEKPEDTLAAFEAVLERAPDNLWFAAGVRFSSFVMVQSVVVIAASIGESVEFDLFGISSLRVTSKLPEKTGPEQDQKVAPEPRHFASIDIAIRGRYSVKDGDLWIRGAIVPGSYVFDPECHLSGGFAFQAWFQDENRGDFALTLGGYHPRFQKPPHYPDVPRLALDWQVTKQLSIKASAYLAITSRALMAGGRLEVSYRSESGSVRAFFIAEADFLIAWAPLYYVAKIRVAIAAEVNVDAWVTTIELSLHVEAMLHMEGPPFSGYAAFRVAGVRVLISFGGKPSPESISWEDFAARFLPKKEEILTLRAEGFEENPEAMAILADGRVTRKLVLVLGRHWKLSVQSAIPARRVLAGCGPLPIEGKTVTTSFGVQPVGEWLDVSDLEITREGWEATGEDERSPGDPEGAAQPETPWADLAKNLGFSQEAFSNPAPPALWSDRRPPAPESVSEGPDPRLDAAVAPPAPAGLTLRSTLLRLLPANRPGPASQPSLPVQDRAAGKQVRDADRDTVPAPTPRLSLLSATTTWGKADGERLRARSLSRARSKGAAQR